jgi:hypothetical protein
MLQEKINGLKGSLIEAGGAAVCCDYCPERWNSPRLFISDKNFMSPVHVDASSCLCLLRKTETSWSLHCIYTILKFLIL